MAGVVNLRDLSLLVAAVVVGILLYDYFAVPIALLGLSLIQWTGVPAGTPALAVGSVPEAIAAIMLGVFLVLATAAFAQDPRRLALLLAISLPLVMVIGFTAAMTDLLPLDEAFGLAIRTFAIEALAFSMGCFLTSKLLRRQRLGLR